MGGIDAVEGIVLAGRQLANCVLDSNAIWCTVTVINIRTLNILNCYKRYCTRMNLLKGDFTAWSLYFQHASFILYQDAFILCYRYFSYRKCYKLSPYVKTLNNLFRDWIYNEFEEWSLVFTLISKFSVFPLSIYWTLNIRQKRRDFLNSRPLSLTNSKFDKLVQKVLRDSKARTFNHGKDLTIWQFNYTLWQFITFLRGKVSSLTHPP